MTNPVQYTSFAHIASVNEACATAIQPFTTMDATQQEEMLKELRNGQCMDFWPCPRCGHISDINMKSRHPEAWTCLVCAHNFYID